MIIYKIVNKINGKSYVGQTRQKLSVRWRQHVCNTSHCSLLSRAIKKYGADAFEIIELFSTDDAALLNQKEVELIRDLNTLSPQGYNLTSGGEGGYIRSENTKRLLAEANKGKSRPHTAASKAKLSAMRTGALNPMFGRKQSEETRRKRSEALKGRKRPPEVIAKIKASHNSKSDLNLTFRRKS